MPTCPCCYDAVIFDLDGTLLNTLGDLADSMNAALATFDFPPHPVEAYRFFVGDGIMNLARRVLPDEHKGDEELAKKLRGVMSDIYDKNWKNKTRPYDGIPELLDALSERGIPFGILTNKPDHAAQFVVAELLPHWNFAAVQGLSETVLAKPDPSGARAMIAQFGTTPEKILYLGDTDTDMKTATTVGMAAVGVTWGFRPEEELREHGAWRIIHHPLEALPLLSEAHI